MRLFVAIEVPERIRARIGARLAAARGELPRTRWVPVANLHLTLAFLGERPASAVPRLDARLAPVFRRSPPLELRTTTAGSFPSGRPPRVLWLGLESSEGLLQLQRAVAEAAATVFDEEPEGRRFHPHLTLARLRGRWPRAAVERWRGVFGEDGVGAFRADRGSLMESQLTADGARYRALTTYPMEGAS